MLERFSVSDVIGLQERQLALSQLEKLGTVWIGSDVTIEKPVVVNEGELVREVNLIINKKDLPNIEITRGALRSLGLSVRSFYAQTGIEVMFHGGDLSDEMLKDINNGKDTSVPIGILNHGQRPVEVDGNVMRFFWANDRKRLRKQDLVNTIKSGEFSVDGVEGEDWYLRGYDEENRFTTTNGSNDALCVVVQLKPERYYIPYESEPVRKDNTKSIRDNLSTLLKQIPEGENIQFEIGETPRIKLGPNIVAVINTGATDEHQRHIKSPLIDPGFDWPIRTETLHGLKYVEFFLYKK